MNELYNETFEVRGNVKTTETDIKEYARKCVLKELKELFLAYTDDRTFVAYINRKLIENKITKYENL